MYEDMRLMSEHMLHVMVEQTERILYGPEFRWSEYKTLQIHSVKLSLTSLIRLAAASISRAPAATTTSATSESEMLARLEAEMKSLRNLAADGDINWSDQFVSGVSDKDESHQPRGSHDHSPHGCNGTKVQTSLCK